MAVVVFALTTLLAGAFAAWLFVRNRDLEARYKKAEGSIGQTSRLLIEKNVELFDQNISQQKALALKDDFVAIASHQLRTPLNEIKWALGELIDEAKDQTLKASYEQIFGSAKRMERLVEGLLQFVEIEQGHTRIAITPYDPNVVVKMAAERLANDFKGANLTQTLLLNYTGTMGSLDDAALDVIVSNLVENAYHYTPAPGSITIETSQGEREALHLRITDSGKGIPADMLSNIFLKFRRGEEAIARNKEGSGLGLYIVKTLVDRCGGTITFESKEGKGSTFEVTIPKERAARR